MPSRIPVTFSPSGEIVWVERGTRLLDAARAAGVVIPAACAGRGVCGACGVRLLSGELSPASDAETHALRRAPAGVRLSCQATVVEPVTVSPLLASTAHPSTTEAANQSARAASAGVVAGVDLGTTSVVAATATALGGRLLEQQSVSNLQQSWGADVLSRIVSARSGQAAELAEASQLSVASALSRALAGAPGTLSRIAVSGNSTMAALFMGADVTGLASHPFRAPSYQMRADASLVADEFSGAELLVLPPISAFVGGDTLAGLIDTGMLWSEQSELLVDLGTNAEIALVHGGTLYVASAAAGPAFEAVGIESGMPAEVGAVVGVRSDERGELVLEVVGGGEPAGVAGSGLVAAAALLLRAGHLAVDGRLSASGPFSSRFEVGADGVLRFSLDHPGDVRVSQLDVRALQLAKAAVMVAVSRVLAAADVNGGVVASTHVAGAFGGAIAASDLVSLGILPASVRTSVASSGNTSVRGALEVALEPDILPDAVVRARDAVHVDLAADPSFNDELLRALELRHFD